MPALQPKSALHELARLHGVQISFTNMAGEEQSASDDTLRGVLAALGQPAGSDAEIADSLRQTRLDRLGHGVPPVLVAWDGKPFTAEFHLPGATRLGRASLRLEDGRVRQLADTESWRKAGTRRLDGVSYATVRCRLPALPEGYHELEVDTGMGVQHSLLISAPVRAYSDPQLQRGWGVFLPVYAAHSKNSWGAGNFTDWQHLCQWAGSLGATVCGTLPLLSTFLDSPACHPSPYSPASRLFWNEFFVDITRVPEFAMSLRAQQIVASSAFQKELAAVQSHSRVDYEREWKLRRTILEVLAKEFFARPSPRLAAFDRFQRERPEVENYARFRAVCDRTGVSWHQWPRRLRDGRLKEGDFDEATRDFRAYIQWLAHEQVGVVSGYCREKAMRLYLDLPLGVDGDSYDLWRERDSFTMAASAGAPPDMFFTRGQNWGFAPLHPRRIRELRYRYVLDYLRFQMRRAGILRIDHVMGLHRLYWIPQGRSPLEGAYVQYPAEELYAILALESNRHRTVLIGENLGTVPPEVNQSMERHNLRTMFIVPFEQQSDPEKALRPPPRNCIAGLNTHDMPTFAAQWRGLDIIDHARLGLITSKQVRDKRAQRRALNEALASFLKANGFLKSPTNRRRVLDALLVWLAKGPAELALVNVEDLLGEIRPQNTPGTSSERPNWQNKARRRIERILSDRSLKVLLRKVDRARRGMR